ncbi:MAG: hypothetical protein AAGA58_17370 [Verrucomicrobiota bacterium]
MQIPSSRFALSFLLSSIWATPLLVADGPVHLTYHWHMHQPIYWPERAPSPQSNRYQFGADSVDLKLSDTGNYYTGSTAEHPQNHLVQGDGGSFDEVFSKADRVNAYQFGGKNSIATLATHADAGASVSYSGSLQENIWSFGKDNRYGYGTNWNQGYTEASGRGPLPNDAWLTSSGHPKADMVGITYHHSFSPLLPKSVLRKEIQIFKEIWWKSWSGNPNKSDHSKGFWPPEVAFSKEIIDVLVDEGYEWTIIANSRLARTCQNYMDVAQRGNSGWNIDPPNRADRLGPTVPANQWWSGTIDGRGGAFPAPFAYQPHYAKHVNPYTGAEKKMVVVPMCDLLSYQNGFSSMGTGDIDAEIAPFNNTNHPSLVLMAHDGDNAWGGGSSYYFESVPNLMNEASSKGYKPTTIQQYLHDHPVPQNSVVHVEDGSWVNAANDWGHPQFINWLWPPVRPSSDPDYDGDDPRTWFDPENGWASDYRNWAVIVAATNIAETAEQLTIDDGGSVLAWKIQEPYQKDGTNNTPNTAEQAWHFLLGALDSGFMYYGVALDDEVKQTLACNIATDIADPLVQPAANTEDDTTPPTIFKPQRFPWNPGGMGWGPLTGYREVGFNGQAPYDSDFHVWTLIHDISGTTNATLYVREDADGVNPVNDNANEIFAGGNWTAIPMTSRAVPTGNVYNDSEINYFLTPNHIAKHYWAKVEGYRDVLLDYYIEAVDGQGNVSRSGIQHVYVEDDGAPPDSGGGDSGSLPDFTMDGVVDSPGYRISTLGLELYAAVRGDELYLATQSPGTNGANDHFLFVSDSATPALPASPAPWAKSGMTDLPASDPFIGSESTNDYAGWFNQGNATNSVTKDNSPSGHLEGMLNLAEAFGTMPTVVYLASAAYETADGGALSGQSPAGNANADIDFDELLAIPIDAIRDENADGVFDFLDPKDEFRITQAADSGSGYEIRWRSIPGFRYSVEKSTDLKDRDPMPELDTVGPGAATEAIVSTASDELTKCYIRVKALGPQ